MNSSSKNLLMGRIISTLGDSLYRIGVIWYVYQLTNNSLYTGIATAITFLPGAVNFMFGPIVDRANKKRILVLSQFIQFLVILNVPIAIYFGYENVYIVLGVVFILSFVENIEGTAEVAIIPKIIKQEHFAEFNSKVKGIEQIIELVSAAVFTMLIARISILGIYTFNALTFLLAIFFFVRIATKKDVTKEEKLNVSSYKRDLIDGFKSFFGTEIITICLPFLIVNFIMGIIMAILPEYADVTLGSNTYGYFMLVIGLGMLIGTVLSSILLKYPLGLLLCCIPLVSFSFLLLSILSGNSILSLVLFGVAFIPFGVLQILLITYLQTSIPPDKIARVSSIIDSILVSTLPLGSIIGGLLASVLGPITLMSAVSVCIMLIGVYFIIKKDLRQLSAISS